MLTEDDHVIGGAVALVAQPQQAPRRRHHPQHVEVVPGNQRAPVRREHRCSAAGHAEPGERRDPGNRHRGPRLVAQLRHQRPWEVRRPLAVSRVRDQPQGPRMGYGQRTQERCVDDGEHAGVESHPQRNRHQGHCRHHRGAPPLAQCITSVTHRGLKCAQAPGIGRFLAQATFAAKPNRGLTLCRRSRKSTVRQVACQLRPVKPHLFGQLSASLRSAAHRAQAIPQPDHRFHQMHKTQGNHASAKTRRTAATNRSNSSDCVPRCVRPSRVRA